MTLSACADLFTLLCRAAPCCGCRYDWPWWMKLANTRIQDGKVQLGELTGGKMDDITVLVAMVEEAELQVLDPTAAAAAAAAAGSNGSNGTSGAAAGDKVSSSSGGTYSLMEGANGNGNGSSNGVSA